MRNAELESRLATGIENVLKIRSADEDGYESGTRIIVSEPRLSGFLRARRSIFLRVLDLRTSGGIIRSIRRLSAYGEAPSRAAPRSGLSARACGHRWGAPAASLAMLAPRRGGLRAA